MRADLLSDSNGLAVASEIVRLAFDDTKIWGHSGIEPDTETAAERVRAELTDLVVVALNMAEDLGFDVVAAAVEKSGADIQLGER